MHDLSLYLLELLENAVHAGASVVAVELAAEREADRFTMRVEDDGPGLPVSQDEALDPFFTTKDGGKGGLGLSLFRQEAEAAGGRLVLGRSAELGGAEIDAVMSLTNVDRPPLGDVATTVLTMAATNPGVDFRVTLKDGDETTALSGSELPGRLPDLVAYQEALR